MYRISGRLDAEPETVAVSATWTDDGRLEGDAIILDAVAALVAARGRVLLTPAGPDILPAWTTGGAR